MGTGEEGRKLNLGRDYLLISLCGCQIANCQWVYFDSSNVPDINNNGSNFISWNNIAEADNGGPLYHMNTLADTLPCKRGLSSFYDGKSQSFSCLADVKCGEDLAKPEDSYNRKKKLKRFQSRGIE
ncbi:hypothetical protein KI387_043824, partial [Taxus chinensis]